jgi:hypothetical protein
MNYVSLILFSFPYRLSHPLSIVCSLSLTVPRSNGGKDTVTQIERWFVSVNTGTRQVMHMVCMILIGCRLLT